MPEPASSTTSFLYGRRDHRPTDAIDKRTVTSVRLRSEVNGLVLPFFFLTKRSTAAVIEYTRTERRDGEIVDATWKVVPHPAYGRPGPLAHRVHRAVEQLITERGLPIANPIPFSIHDLCRRAGLAAGGTEYHKVKQALLSIKATQVESKGAFYAKTSTRYIDDVFSLYDRITFAGESLPDGTIAEKNLLWLGARYAESLNALYARPLDYRFYRALRTPTARRLYELLGVKFYRVADNPHPWIRYRYSTLCQLLPMTRHGYRSQVQQQLAGPHRELLDGGFIASVKLQTIPHSRDWLITYYPGERALNEIRATRTKKQE